MLPELLELVDERVLQLVEGREHGIGEVLADMPEDLLGGIEFGTVGWQIKRMHVLGPNNLTAAMTARTIQHHSDRTLAQFMAQMLQEELQGGRAPNGHQRRRSQVIRPKRPSSMATTRASFGRFTRLPKFF